MNLKKTVMAAFSYVVLSMAVAFPWHMIWFHDLYAEWGAFTRAEPIVPLGMLSMVIQEFVIAYLYPFYYRGEGHSVLQGIKFSLIIGLMVYTVMGFATAAKMQIEPIADFLLYHTVFQTIQFTLTGAALGLIFRQSNQTKNQTEGENNA